ncbi:MAG: ImmA/IrrE family metallo-endopeptidase [Alphaproteobacteria bacterium]|nr:ImmA/IrrE family metallo-endopeptidase [Alphaproteobacteria bacterium]
MDAPLELDRVEVEAVGGDPAGLAAAIHDQLPDLSGAVPVHAIARALDIEEIREESLTSFEACLLTDPHKSRGAILVNRDSSVERRRYSIAHELGHFLNERHRPTADEGFRCSLDDLRESQSIDRYRQQEAEANRFAIELLAPAHLVRPHLGREPDLAQVLAMAQALILSREAAARRYVARQGTAIAIVFSRAGLIRYVEKSAGFPHLRIWAGCRLPELPKARRSFFNITAQHETDPAAWLSAPRQSTLLCQTLYQAEGHAMTLLRLDQAGDRGDR